MDIQTVLTKAGNNKEELLKVIDHYSKRRRDSLKLKSALWLISNMESHYSVSELNATPFFVKYSFNFLDSLVRSIFFENKTISSYKFVDSFYEFENGIPSFEFIDSLIVLHNNSAKDTRYSSVYYEKIDSVRKLLVVNSENTIPVKNRANDLSKIDSKFLIDHIDNAFKMWYESPFAKDMDFEEFTQTMLNYRLAKEPIGDLSSIYKSHFYNIVQPPGIITIEEMVRRFNLYLQLSSLFKTNEINYGNIGLYDIFHWENMECIDRTIWSAKVLNSCGIPTVIDYTPSFKNKSLGLHFWNAVRDTSGIYKPFNPYWQGLNETSYFNQTSKVFRLSYKLNKESLAFLNKKQEQIPKDFSSPYLMDVTEQYHTVTDIVIPLKNQPEKKYGYLAVFKPDGWSIVAWGKINKESNSITFKKIPVNVSYMVGYYNDSIFSPTCRPFYVSQNGEIKKLVSDTSKKIDLLLTRKYPAKEKMIKKMKETCGTFIQGADTKDFSDAVNLYKLSQNDLSEMVVKSVKIEEKQKFKYLRCINSDNKLINLSILEAYSLAKTGEAICKGTQPYILTPNEINLTKQQNLTLISSKPREIAFNNLISVPYICRSKQQLIS